jgi:hypothetical protein
VNHFLKARERSLAAKGRPMTLRRQLTTSTKIDVTVQGFLTLFRADQVGMGSIMQGDGIVAILNDEIATASWPGPGRSRDQMIIDGRTWAVLGSTPIYEAGVCIGHSISVRGG